MIVEIHVSPTPSGTNDNRYAHVEAAIALAQQAGLTYEVGALGTTIEGSPDDLWPLIRSMHEATLQSGANSVMTNMRLAQHGAEDGPRMKNLVAKFR